MVSNSADSALLVANFDDLEAIQLNTDANKSSGLRSVAFHYNTCGGGAQMDIVAANTNGGDLRLYAGGSNQWQISTSLCSEGNCPQRPDGLSTNNGGLLVAANTGAAGTQTELWFFEPTCDGGTFRPGVRGIFSNLTIGAIADTEFVRVPGGGLGEGDLLVTTQNPPQIVVVRASAITDLLEASEAGDTPLPSLATETLVPEGFFGTTSPASMAFVPGTAGVGSSTDGISESEYVLVTAPPARVLKLNFGSVDYSSASMLDPLFNLAIPGLGNGPLGVAAGTRGADTFGVVVDRQQGRAIRVRLNVAVVDDGVTLDVFPISDCSASDPNCSQIKSGLKFPQGVAYNSNAVAGLNCSGSEGCAISGAIQLYLPAQGSGPTPNTLQFSTQQSSADDIIIGELFLVEDTRTGSTPLEFPGALAGYSLPAVCRGFDLDDDEDTPAIVPVVKLTKNFAATPGTLVNVQELLSGLFPQIDNCGLTGSRVYHTSEEPGSPSSSLIDKTIVCTNPSRGANGGLFSPFALCADHYYGRSLSNQEKTALKAEVFGRIANLEAELADLPVLAPVNPVYLQGLLDNIKGTILKKNRPFESEYVLASKEFSKGAAHVLSTQNNIAWEQLGEGNESAFGDFLTLWVALAFYTSETAGRVVYCPIDDVPGIDALLPGFAEGDISCR